MIPPVRALDVPPYVALRVDGSALENVALRHQLAVLQRSVRRPRLSRWDRIFWLGFSVLGGRSSLHIVRLPTVLAWHRRGF
jgi:hypothetical protein